MSQSSEDLFKQVVSHCKEYGFVFPSSELYDGLSAVYDYGPRGVALKNNIRAFWWKSMTRLHGNIVGIDSAIFMHPRIWKASGHVDGFSDPMIDNKDSKKRYRADQLIEEYVLKLETKVQKEITKAQKKWGSDFDLEQFVNTNPKVLRYKAEAKQSTDRLNQALEANHLDAVKALIVELDIRCPVSGTGNWTDVKQFNLMYSTQMNATEGEDAIYLRPETAQGIFVNFLNVQKTARMKIPFGIAQTGKAFRNEIVARQFIMRMKEFEQMEMQFFVKPGTELEWFDYWRNYRKLWHLTLGIESHKLRFHKHEKLAHYANAAEDIEYQFPFGFRELEGIHSRTNFDLSKHQTYSGKKISYFDPESQSHYVPYVVETSVGLDRLFLMLMCECLKTEETHNAETRTVLALPPELAPIKLAIMPLVAKDGLPELAMNIFNHLKYDIDCFIEEKDSIGKRYRRQDAIGTPFCATIDHQSLDDHTVTVRYRDSMNQQRVPMQDLKKLVLEHASIENLLKKLPAS